MGASSHPVSCCGTPQTKGKSSVVSIQKLTNVGGSGIGCGERGCGQETELDQRAGCPLLLMSKATGPWITTGDGDFQQARGIASRGSPLSSGWQDATSVWARRVELSETASRLVVTVPQSLCLRTDPPPLRPWEEPGTRHWQLRGGPAGLDSVPCVWFCTERGHNAVRP